MEKTSWKRAVVLAGIASSSGLLVLFCLLALIPSLRAMVWPSSFWPFGTAPGADLIGVSLFLILLVFGWSVVAVSLLIRLVPPIDTAPGTTFRWALLGMVYSVLNTAGLVLILRAEIDAPVRVIQGVLSFGYLAVSYWAVFRAFPPKTG